MRESVGGLVEERAQDIVGERSKEEEKFGMSNKWAKEAAGREGKTKYKWWLFAS